MEEKEKMQNEWGSLAEESMKVSGIFDAAQKAADEYLESVKKRSADQEERLNRIDRELAEKSAETLARCEKMLTETQAECERMSLATKTDCDKLYQQTQEKCDDMLTSAESLCMKREDASREKCREMEQSIEEKCMNLAQQTKEKCADLENRAQEEIDEKWSLFRTRLEKFIAAKGDLQEVMDFMMQQKGNNGNMSEVMPAKAAGNVE